MSHPDIADLLAQSPSLATLVGHDPFEPGILLLQLLEPLGLVDLHHPELLLPAVEGLFADLVLPADVENRFSCIGFPQNGHSNEYLTV